MSIQDIYAELEAEFAWRQDEILFFQNIYARAPNSSDLDQCRRSLILFLYAHFEGFCKFALLTYIKYINQQNLLCKDVINPISAASLYEIFYILRNPSKKSDIFRTILPDDSTLHRIARDIDFLNNFEDFGNKIVNISDKLVDTESNLKPVVLKKNLYQLGLDYLAIVHLEPDIHKLLNYRNSIAHGSRRHGIDQSEYETIRNSTFDIMSFIKQLVFQCIRDHRFLK